MFKFIEVKGAWEHNLKNVSVKIPKNQLIAVTGPSGSGKSTFAFDVLQRECQRQYMESMGLVTDGMNKAKVKGIVGLSPSISIAQGIHNRNPRSTVGTFTEIFTYLRLLYAKCGQMQCPNCQRWVEPEYASEGRNEEGRMEGERPCPFCGASLPVLTMAHFSFNKSQGCCKTCNGIGEVNAIDPSAILDERLTVAEGAVQMWQGLIAKHYEHVLLMLAKHYDLEFNVKKPIKAFNALERLIFFEGVDSEKFKALYPTIKPPRKVSDGYFEGILTFLRKKSAENIRKGSTNKKIERCFSRKICQACEGTRLNDRARSVMVGGKSIVEITSKTISELDAWLDSLQESVADTNRQIMEAMVGDIQRRIQSILRIGLGYLTIDRTLQSLSGGEAQRLRMSSLLDSGLTGVLYILDEPTAGLHPKDTEKILDAMKALVKIGNTVLVIEHDMDFVRKCDHIIEFGPLAGSLGGQLVAEGSPGKLIGQKSSLTARYLKRGIRIKDKIRTNDIPSIRIIGARDHNLKNLSLSIPLNRFVTVSGVSGSGKSTLIFEVLAKAYQGQQAKVDGIEGFDEVNRMIVVNQKRIGRSSRSTVATYTDLFTPIRETFAKLPEAQDRGLKSSDFSFNVKGGRCEKCKGLGTIPLDMHFLNDIEVECPLCCGKRFHSRVLEVSYKGYTISEILDRTVDQNRTIFSEQKEILKRLEVLHEVGLGYLQLGQSTSTLSGGECQRIKLSKELVKTGRGNNLFLLDEPTTGLHPNDTEKLIGLLNKLVDRGNSVIVIEHALDVIAQSDWVIDMGLEGGALGGNIAAQGPPTAIAKARDSHTGRYLSGKHAHWANVL